MSGHLIIIFGGSGFIGRHLVGRLAAKGHQIRLAVRDPESASQLMTQGVVGQIAGFKTNVRDQRSVDRGVADADIVINLVGILNERGDTGQGFHKTHVVLTEKILTACRQHGIKRLLHMSALHAAHC